MIQLRLEFWHHKKIWFKDWAYLQQASVSMLLTAFITVFTLSFRGQWKRVFPFSTISCGDESITAFFFAWRACAALKNFSSQIVTSSIHYLLNVICLFYHPKVTWGSRIKINVCQILFHCKIVKEILKRVKSNIECNTYSKRPSQMRRVIATPFVFSVLSRCLWFWSAICFTLSVNGASWPTLHHTRKSITHSGLADSHL